MTVSAEVFEFYNSFAGVSKTELSPDSTIYLLPCVRAHAIPFKTLLLSSVPLCHTDHCQVSADGHKVRRSTPLVDPEDVDKRTVYVEDLPPGTTIDSIKRHFGQCGSVEYIQ